MTLSGATTPGQNEPGSDGSEGILRIPQSSSITESSPSDCLVSYLGHSWGVFPFYRDAVGVFYTEENRKYHRINENSDGSHSTCLQYNKATEGTNF